MNRTNVEIKEIKKGAKGLFANQSVEKGKIILVLQGEKFSKPSRTSIQIEDKHIEDPEGGYMNHHCDPSAEIKINSNFVGFNLTAQCETNQVILVTAKRDIKKGDEITFDYETTEEELMYSFKCDCHGRWIKGNKLKHI